MLAIHAPQICYRSALVPLLVDTVALRKIGCVNF